MMDGLGERLQEKIDMLKQISKELKRLEELGLKPHEAVGKGRSKW